MFLSQFATKLECMNERFREQLTGEDRSEFKITGMYIR